MQKIIKKERDAKSVGHLHIGNILKNYFKNRKIVEEHSYKKILLAFYKRNPDIPRDESLIARSARLKADWAILDLKILIEVQGDQHYEPVAFSGDKNLAELEYNCQVIRDRTKRVIAEEANWLLIEIPYSKNYVLNDDDILNIIKHFILYN